MRKKTLYIRQVIPSWFSTGKEPEILTGDENPISTMDMFFDWKWYKKWNKLYNSGIFIEKCGYYDGQYGDCNYFLFLINDRGEKLNIATIHNCSNSDFMQIKAIITKK